MREARLVPRAALPYLDVAVPAHVHHAELAPLRREALDVLAAGYRSTSRTLLGVLAWVTAAGGATLLAVLPWQPAAVLPTVLLTVLGAVLLGCGAWLAAGVLRSGRRITGAAAAWLRVPAAGATDTDASALLDVVRWRAVLGGAAAAGSVALTVTLAYVLAQTGALGATYLGAATPPPVSEPTRAVLVAALAVAALGAAGVAVGSFGGVRTVAEAAWRRPTVASTARATPAAPESFAPVGPLVPPAHAAAAAAAVPAAQAAAGVPAARVAEILQPDGPPTVAIDLSGLRAAAAGPEQAQPWHMSSTQLEILLPDGRALAEGTTLLGRRPQVRPEDLVDAVVVLSDQTVTKTHAAITVEGTTVHVVDRASTNGTLLEASDGSLVRCRPWQVTTVRAPSTIHLGRTRLHVRAAATRRPLEVA